MELALGLLALVFLVWFFVFRNPEKGTTLEEINNAPPQEEAKPEPVPVAAPEPSPVVLQVEVPVQPAVVEQTTEKPEPTKPKAKRTPKAKTTDETPKAKKPRAPKKPKMTITK